jgi:chromosome segregation ATPase
MSSDKLLELQAEIIVKDQEIEWYKKQVQESSDAEFMLQEKNKLLKIFSDENVQVKKKLEDAVGSLKRQEGEVKRLTTALQQEVQKGNALALARDTAGGEREAKFRSDMKAKDDLVEQLRADMKAKDKRLANAELLRAAPSSPSPEVQTLKEQLKQAKKEARTASLRLESRTKSVARLTNEMKKMEGDRKSLLLTIDESKSDLKAALERAEDFKEKAEIAEVDMSHSKVRRQTMADDLGSLQVKLQIRAELLGNAEESREKLDSENKRLRQKLRDQEGRASSSESDAQEIKDLKREVSSLKLEIEEMEAGAGADDQGKVIAALSQQLAHQKVLLRKAEDEREALIERLDQRDGELEDCQRHLKDAHGDADNRQTELRQAKECFVRENRQLEDTVRQAKRQTVDVLKMYEELETSVVEYKHRIRSLESRKEGLEGQIVQLEEEIVHLEKLRTAPVPASREGDGGGTVEGEEDGEQEGEEGHAVDQLEMVEEYTIAYEDDSLPAVNASGMPNTKDMTEAELTEEYQKIYRKVLHKLGVIIQGVKASVWLTERFTTMREVAGKRYTALNVELCDLHLPSDKRRKWRRAIEVEYAVHNEVESFIGEIMSAQVEDDEDADSKYQPNHSIHNSRRHNYATNRGVIKSPTERGRRRKAQHSPPSMTVGMPVGRVKKQVDPASLGPYQPRLFVNKTDHEGRRKGKGWL